MALRKSVALIGLFGFLCTTLILLAAANFTDNIRFVVAFVSPFPDLIVICSVQKAGGVIGVITALNAYYIGVSELLAAEKHPVVDLPLGEL